MTRLEKIGLLGVIVSQTTMVSLGVLHQNLPVLAFGAVFTIAWAFVFVTMGEN